MVDFRFDSTRISEIRANGLNILTGGGAYLIGSQTGRDLPSSNYSSIGSTNGRMTNGGPPFRLTFHREGANSLLYELEVGPHHVDIERLDFAIDLQKPYFDRIEFAANRYELFYCSGRQIRSGSGLHYSDIPVGCEIRDGNIVYGYVGIAMLKPIPAWGESIGMFARVRLEVHQHENGIEMSFANHPGTNNLGIGFGRLRRGRLARARGRIVVTPLRVADWSVRLEVESPLFGHQVGRLEREGWSVSTRSDQPNRYMVYGPYIQVPEGRRQATFVLLVDNNTADNNKVVRIDVAEQSGTSVRSISHRDLRRRDFRQALQHQEFTLPFSARYGHPIEFRTFWYGGCYVLQDCVILR